MLAIQLNSVALDFSCESDEDEVSYVDQQAYNDIATEETLYIDGTELNDAIADYLSNKYGWAVQDFKIASIVSM